MESAGIIQCVEAVTSRWTKQRKAEDRDARAEVRRQSKLTGRHHRVTIKQAAWEVMAEAYRKASGNGAHPASTRQIYYQARPHVLARTGNSTLDSNYFSQRLVPEYIESHPVETAKWDVVYDARGHFLEPHTGREVALGTLAVRDYLEEVRSHSPRIGTPTSIGPILYPTKGPLHRFSALLFIEKEGFTPLIQAADLAERYDIAIMSTKGMPVTACRQLADQLCGPFGIPLLLVHDFDKAGFSMVGTFLRDASGNERVTRYEYEYAFRVIDLGLRLEDVQQWNLQSEPVVYRSANGATGDPRRNLEDNGAEPEEIAFLCDGGDSQTGYQGRRVELNAFSSPEFIEWIESGLDAYGIGKVVPDDNTLVAASDFRPVQNHQHAYFLLYPDEFGNPTRLIAYRHTSFDGVADPPFEVEAILAASRMPVFWQGGDPDWSLRLVPLPFETPVPAGCGPEGASAAVWVSTTPFVPPNRRRFRENGRLRAAETVTVLLQKALTESLRLMGSPATVVAVQPVDSHGNPVPAGPNQDPAEACWVTVHETRAERSRRLTNRTRPVRPGFRLRIMLSEPVCGPICLGHSCHFGLGLFVPDRC